MSDLYTIDKLKKHFEVTAEELLPSQSGNSGKFLTTDGSDIEWASVDALPSQSGNSGKYLTTNGETASWTTVDALPDQAGNSGKYLTTDGSSASWEDIDEYTLPTASSSTLGGVKVGTNLSIDSSTGVLSATDTVTTVTVTGEGNAITNITDSNGALTATKGSTFSLSNHTHDNVYAPLASPTFTGTPTAPTADAGTNTTQIATTAFVNTAVSSLVNSAPGTLDTLNELAAALGNDPNFATTIASDIGSKLDSDSANYVKGPSISGTTITVTAGDNSTSTLTTQDTTYTLPEATTSTLGGVIVGNGLSVTNGTISVDDQLPTQTNNSGKFLTTNGTTASWSTVDALPSQTGNSGKYLTTNGSIASWVAIESYSLPTAAADTLGGVKIGNGITITNGVISADDQLPSQANNSGKYLTTNGTSASWVTIESYVLPTAASDTLGGIKVGTNLSIDSNGVLSATDTTYSAATTEAAGLMSAADKTKLDNIDTGANNYSLPIAGSSTLGGVKVGSNLSINSSTGVLSADNQLPAQTNNSGKFLSTNGTTASWTSISEYSLPIASSSALGGIKVGTNLSINDTTGVLSATDTVTTATTSGDGNAVTSITATNGALTVTKGSTFSLSTHNHDNVYAPLASPAFTGTPTAPTATAGTNSTQVATTAYVDSAVSSLVNSAPTTLDTLNELAAALGNDPNFATTVSTSIGEKLDADSANYVKSLSISGTTITVTKGNDTTSTLTTQDTTYSAGDGITLTGTTFRADDQLPSQTGNSGKFLTTDGTDASWSDILNETKISSVHYPTANATTVVLTQAQAIPSTNNKYAMSVYRNGIYLNPSIDYGYNNSTRTLTFTNAFEDDEIVTVVFSYLDTDSQVTLDIDVDEYEAGSGITFTNNAVTNKVVINADDQLPSQTSNSGKFLTTNGTSASWATVDTFPSQSGNSGKFLTTNGSAVSWATVDALPSQTGNSGKFLTTNGTAASWEDVFAGEVRVSSTHNPTENATTIVLTTAQVPANDVTKWGLSVYRDGIFLINGIDYTYASNSRTLTFTRAFSANEVVSVNFSYVSSDTETIWEVPTQTGQAGKFLTTDGTDVSWATVDALPSQTNNSGKFLTTNGSTVSWETVDALPNQTNNSGKYLTTNGASASWATITQYTLPEATTSTLGGVIVGSGLSVNNGTISVNDQLPSQTSNSGKFLTTNGTSASWATVDALPSQTGNSGKFLTTNGTTASWATISLESLTDNEVNAIFDAAVGLTNANVQEY